MQKRRILQIDSQNLSSWTPHCSARVTLETTPNGALITALSSVFRHRRTFLRTFETRRARVSC